MAPGDDNVHYQGTERMINELVSAEQVGGCHGVPEPDATRISEGQGTTLHIYSLLTRYLMTEPADKGALRTDAVRQAMLRGVPPLHLMERGTGVR